MWYHHHHVCFVCITLFLGSLSSETAETKPTYSSKNGSFKVTLLKGCTTEPLSYLALSNLPSVIPQFTKPTLLFMESVPHKAQVCHIEHRRYQAKCLQHGYSWSSLGGISYVLLWGGWGCCLGWYLKWRLCLINRIYFHRKIYVILSHYDTYRCLYFQSCL